MKKLFKNLENMKKLFALALLALSLSVSCTNATKQAEANEEEEVKKTCIVVESDQVSDELISALRQRLEGAGMDCTVEQAEGNRLLVKVPEITPDEFSKVNHLLAVQGKIDIYETADIVPIIQTVQHLAAEECSELKDVKVQGQHVSSIAVSEQDTARINRILNKPEVRNAIPDDISLLWAYQPLSRVTSKGYCDLCCIQKSGRSFSVNNYAQKFELNYSYRDEPVIRVQMNEEGGQLFAELTKLNILKQIAIVIDDVVYTMPWVQSEISGGSFEVSFSDFSEPEVQDLIGILSHPLSSQVRVVSVEY